MFANLFYMYNITVVMNATAILRCDDSSNVTWMYYPHIPINEEIIYMNNTKMGRYIADDRYAVEKSNLIVKNIHDTNQGHYLCRNDEKHSLRFFNLTISDNRTSRYKDSEYKSRFNRSNIPTMITNKEIEAFEGDSIIFNCSDGNDMFKSETIYVNYYKYIQPFNNRKERLLFSESHSDECLSNIEKITMVRRKGTYKIYMKNLSVCDSGLYECTIINDDTSSHLINVKVLKRSPTWWRKTKEDINYARRVRERLSRAREREISE